MIAVDAKSPEMKVANYVDNDEKNAKLEASENSLMDSGAEDVGEAAKPGEKYVDQHPSVAETPLIKMKETQDLTQLKKADEDNENHEDPEDH